MQDILKQLDEKLFFEVFATPPADKTRQLPPAAVARR